jgi:hypothetical protein
VSLYVGGNLRNRLSDFKYYLTYVYPADLPYAGGATGVASLHTTFGRTSMAALSNTRRQFNENNLVSTAVVAKVTISTFNYFKDYRKI